MRHSFAFLHDYNIRTLSSALCSLRIHTLKILPLCFFLSLFPVRFSLVLCNAFTRYWANKSRARGCYPGREGVPVGAGWLAGCCSRVQWPTSACCWVERSSLPFSRCYVTH